MADWMIDQYGSSVRRACSVVMLSTSMYYYRPADRHEELLRMRMRQIAATRVRYGFWRIYILLRREGFTDNHKRVYRLYKAEQLNLRSKRPRRRRSAAHRLARIPTQTIHQVWSMDFASDALLDGRHFRIVAVVDNYSKKCLSLRVGQSLKGQDAQKNLHHICLTEGAFPERLQCDNGSEFISKGSFYMDFSRPGKPTDNPYVESFIGKFRDECLSVNWFLSIEHAQQMIEQYRQEYNQFRSNISLGDLTPEEFIQAHLHTPEYSTFGCL